MGYMGLDKWGESDNAADLVFDVIDAMATVLKKRVPKRDNEFNTNGAVDVALFNESFIKPILKSFPDSYDQSSVLISTLTDAKQRLEKEIEKMESDPDKYMIEGRKRSAKANYLMHLNAYKRMAKNLGKTVEALG